MIRSHSGRLTVWTCISTRSTPYTSSLSTTWSSSESSWTCTPLSSSYQYWQPGPVYPSCIHIVRIMEIVRDKLDIFYSKLLVYVTQCPIFLAETYLKVWPRSMANCAKEMLHVSLFRKDITTLDISRLVIRLVLSGDREGGRQGGGWEASREEGGSIKWTGNCTSEAK